MTRSVPVFVLMAAVVALAACSRPEPPPEPPRPVLTRVAGSGGANAVDAAYVGEIRSRYESALAFRIPGKMVERLVDSGSVVRPGQLLARIDPGDTALSLAGAEAQLALAEADAARSRELRARQFISQAALDAKEAALQAARASAGLARNQRAYTELRADQAGVVGVVAAEVGQVVSAGQVVFRIARQDTLEVALAIPESRIAAVRPGEAAEVTLWADESARLRGRLREVMPVADPVTRTFAARVSLLETDPRVIQGMSAYVRLGARGESGVRIPLGALYQQDGRPAVWVVDAEQRVGLRPVTVLRIDEREAVLANGLRDGERYVAAGVHKLAAGERIQPVADPAAQGGAR